MTLTFPKGCPVVVIGVWAESPAVTAGVRVGDHLLQVDGADIREMSGAQVVNLLRSNGPGTVTVKLSRSAKEYTAVIERQRLSSIVERNGQKSLGGLIVPVDTTEAEVKRLRELDAKRIAARAFPSHYPADLNLYYGGFELMLLRDPEDSMVTGIEEGPASRAGIHPGDRIVSVNGTDLAGRTATEIERLLSSTRPEHLRLKVDRAGAVRTIEFTLERGSAVMKASGKKMVNGQLVSAGFSDEDVRCQTAQK